MTFPLPETQMQNENRAGLSSVLYISRSSICPGTVEAEVESIVAISRVKNQYFGLTGALLYAGEHFAQILEGVRRQNIWHNSRRRSAECGPRLGLMFRRRACSVASADVRVSFA